MNIKQFIEQANLTPLLKQYRGNCGNISRSTLREIKFVKEEYVLEDLKELTRLLTGFNQPKILKGSQKKTAKDAYHSELIKRYDNQKLILDWRKKLGIPPKGLETKARFKKWITGYTQDFQYIKNGKQVTERFCRIRYSGDIKNGTVFESKIPRKEALELALNVFLKEWDLPERYRNSMLELLLFNRIVPAAQGTFLASFESEWSSKKSGAITFDADTTKEEITKLLKKSGSSFKKIKKGLRGKVHRKSRKQEETQKIIDLYNKQKEIGKKDKDIFREIVNRFGISISAVRKRIKGE